MLSLRPISRQNPRLEPPLQVAPSRVLATHSSKGDSADNPFWGGDAMRILRGTLQELPPMPRLGPDGHDVDLRRRVPNRWLTDTTGTKV